MDHTAYSDFDAVYEPSEDSWLFCDALHTDLADLAKRSPALVVELGPGSGIVSTCLLRLLAAAEKRGGVGEGGLSSIETGHPNAICIAADINPAACAMTKETASQDGVGKSLDPVRCELFKGLVPRLLGAVDVLLFNQ